MWVDTLSSYSVRSWGYAVPEECLVVTKKNYKNTLRKVGGTKKLRSNIDKFFADHPRAERAMIRLDD